MALRYPVIAGMFLLLNLIQSQFLQYLSREFLLSIYDEAKYGSITKRIQSMLKSEIDQEFNEAKEIRTGVFRAVARTYQNMTVREQLLVGLAAKGTVTLMSLIVIIP